MLKKWWVAGILAGLTVFVWGFVAHMFFKLGEASLRRLPQEQALMTALAAGIQDSGLYFFPYMEDMAKMQEMYARYPRGLLVFTKTGTPFSFETALAWQVAADIAEMLIAAWLLWMVAGSVPGFLNRVLFVVALSAFTVFASDVPMWNWYEFPARFIVDGVIDKVVGAALGGALLAYLLGRREIRF